MQRQLHLASYVRTVPCKNLATLEEKGEVFVRHSVEVPRHRQPYVQYCYTSRCLCILGLQRRCTWRRSRRFQRPRAPASCSTVYYLLNDSCDPAVVTGRITGLARPSVRPSVCLLQSINHNQFTQHTDTKSFQCAAQRRDQRRAKRKRFVAHGPEYSRTK